MTRAARLLLTVLTLLLGVPVLVLTTSPPAHACSCVAGGVEQYARWADAVFVATLLEPLSAGSTGSVEARAAVETVYDGEVADEVTISTGAQESACGLTRLAAGETWLFYAAELRGDAGFGVSLCGGSSRAGPGRLARVEQALGTGRAVVRPPEQPAGSATTTGTTAIDAPADAAGRSGSRTPWVLGGLALGVVVVGTGGLVLARRRPVSPG